MRRRVQVLALSTGMALLGALSCLPGCSDGAPTASDVCGQAKNRIASCGASLPLFSDGPCTGTSRIVARCVVDHAQDCDELATLFGRIDACAADMLDGGDPLLPPATDLPVPGGDGGRNDAGKDPPPAPPRDAGSDSAGPTLDGGAEAGPVAWAGMDVTGTVLLSEEKRFQTPALPAGSYSFTMTGTGDADLYVRKTSAPTAASYDCRPFVVGSTESCTVTLLAPAIVHVMIHGAVTTSTFTLEGRP